AETERLGLANEDAFHVVGLDGAHHREQLDAVCLFEGVLELEGEIEVILDRPLVPPGDEDHLADAGGVGLLDCVLHERLVDDRKHLLRQRLGGGQESRAEAGDWKDRVSDEHLLTIGLRSREFLHATTLQRGASRQSRWICWSSIRSNPMSWHGSASGIACATRRSWRSSRANFAVPSTTCVPRSFPAR